MVCQQDCYELKEISIRPGTQAPTKAETALTAG